MTISKNETKFCGKTIVDFDPAKGLAKKSVVYRLRTGHQMDDHSNWPPIWNAFLADPKVGQTEALVIGLWDYQDTLNEENRGAIVQQLAMASKKLPKLKALFLGDITYQECEISWIKQSDISPLLRAFPLLEVLRVRGGDGLEIKKPVHSRLKTLILETGGMSRTLVKQLAKANFPALEHLELWLGSKSYGADTTPKDLAPILSGELFPNLTYLGICNSDIADKVAAAAAEAPILEQLEVLDLSKGSLTDKGAAALLAFPLVSRLKKLDLHHHYLSNEMIKKLKKAKIKVDVSAQREAEVYGDDEEDEDAEIYRSIFVAE